MIFVNPFFFTHCVIVTDRFIKKILEFRPSPIYLKYFLSKNLLCMKEVIKSLSTKRYEKENNFLARRKLYKRVMSD